MAWVTAGNGVDCHQQASLGVQEPKSITALIKLNTSLISLFTLSDQTNFEAATAPNYHSLGRQIAATVIRYAIRIKVAAAGLESIRN